MPVGAATLDGGPRGTAYAPRHGALDGLFLRSTHERPGERPGFYRRAYAGVPPDGLARPLTGEGTPRRGACPAALPKTPFLGLGARALFEKPYPPSP